MSKPAIAPITRPAQIRLPDDIHDRLAHLTAADRQGLVTDLAEALTTAQQADDFQPVRRVMLHWYQVARIRSEPKFEAIRRWVETHEPRDEDFIDLDQLRAQYGR